LGKSGLFRTTLRHARISCTSRQGVKRADDGDVAVERPPVVCLRKRGRGSDAFVRQDPVDLRTFLLGVDIAGESKTSVLLPMLKRIQSKSLSARQQRVFILPGCDICCSHEAELQWRTNHASRRQSVVLENLMANTSSTSRTCGTPGSWWWIQSAVRAFAPRSIACSITP